MQNKQMIVMVLEDEELLLKAITKKLEQNNIRALPFASGETGLQYLQGLTVELPDAIWLDYYLKDMNGIEFMEEVKKNPRLAKIPVLVVSNSASPEKVHTILALGAKKYLLKAEHRLDDIIQTLQELLSFEQ